MKRSFFALIAGTLLAASFTVFAAGGAIEGVEKQPINVSAIAPAAEMAKILAPIAPREAIVYVDTMRNLLVFQQRDRAALALQIPG